MNLTETVNPPIFSILKYKIVNNHLYDIFVLQIRTVKTLFLKYITYEKLPIFMIILVWKYFSLHKILHTLFN